MEFFQFHPTGLYRLGILLSEAARGEGAILRNSDGERFMERYAPTIKDLAPRDMVSRAEFFEIKEGRGAGPTRTTSCSTSPTSIPRWSRRSFPTSRSSPAPISTSIPSRRASRSFPTAHYAMGGIPTNVEAEVLATTPATSSPGSTRPASVHACPCTEPTGWGPTRSSTSSCSGGGGASTMAEYAIDTSTMPDPRRRPRSDRGVAAIA